MNTAAKAFPDYDLFLFDLDGTLITSYMDNSDSDYHRWELVKGAVQVVDKLQESGKMVAVITNQAGVGYEYIKESDWTKKMGLVALAFHLSLGQFYVCFAHPNGTKTGEGVFWDVTRRKPSPLMIQDAMAAVGVRKDRTVYIGDMDSDSRAAKNAGVDYIDAGEFFA